MFINSDIVFHCKLNERKNLEANIMNVHSSSPFLFPKYFLRFYHLSSFTRFSLHYVKHCFNKSAHLLAVDGHSVHGFREWTLDIPKDVHLAAMTDLCV